MTDRFSYSILVTGATGQLGSELYPQRHLCTNICRVGLGTMLEKEKRIADLSMEERQKLAEKALKAVGNERRKNRNQKGKTVRRS